MPDASSLVLLFVVATMVALVARRLRLPYTVALVLAGLALGGLHALDPPHLTEELLFSVFLPGLLFEAAFHVDASHLRRNLVAIVALAVPGVVASIALTAVLLLPLAARLPPVADFDWRTALVFGALISATDPIAVVALFKSLGTPRRLGLLLEGESLLNDGTAIVFFTLALGLVAGSRVEPQRLALEFVRVVGIGAMVGAAIGLAVAQVIRRVDDAMIEITLTTIAAYGSFVAAERIDVSGVIATVVAGLVSGNYAARTGMSPSTRIAVESFWEYVAFALDSLVFLLIGFEVRLTTLLEFWQPILVAYLVVQIGRAVIVALVSVALRHTPERLPVRWSAVLAWGGLRGGLSMVLALSLPGSMPHRSFVVTVTFGVVVLSILIQGVTMSGLLRALGIAADGSLVEHERRRGGLQAARAALDELERVVRTRYTSEAATASLREHYRRRIAEEERRLRASHVDPRAFAAEDRRWLTRHLLMVEKQFVLDGYRSGAFGQDAYEGLLSDVDARLVALESGDEAGQADPAVRSDDEPQ